MKACKIIEIPKVEDLYFKLEVKEGEEDVKWGKI